jgi:S1-C subfamily serine protease
MLATSLLFLAVLAQDTLPLAARRVLADDAPAGSPAEHAGLRAGDIITAIGAKTVANLYDMTDALRSHQPGDTVAIAAKRGETEIRVTAVLGKRGG